MPGVPLIPDQRLPGLLANLAQRVSAIEKQQSITWVNALGQALINMGLSPGSNPPQYGMQLIDPAAGDEIGFLGEASDGTVSLRFRDSAGNVQVQLDVGGLHFYNAGTEVVRVDWQGLHVYNPSNVEEVRAGLLDESISQYGLAVLNDANAFQAVSGAIYVLGPDVLSWTSTTPTGITGASLTAEVGSSGQALVSVACEIATGAAGQEGFAQVYVDGAAAGPYLVGASSGGTINAMGAASYVVSGIGAGSHTFQIYVWVTSGSTCGFFQPSLTVQPL